MGNLDKELNELSILPDENVFEEPDDEGDDQQMLWILDSQGNQVQKVGEYTLCQTNNGPRLELTDEGLVSVAAFDPINPQGPIVWATYYTDNWVGDERFAAVLNQNKISAGVEG